MTEQSLEHTPGLYYEIEYCGEIICQCPLNLLDNNKIAATNVLYSTLIEKGVLTIRALGYALDSWIISGKIENQILLINSHFKLKNTQGGLVSYDITPRIVDYLVELRFSQIDHPYRVLIENDPVSFCNYIKQDFRYFFIALVKGTLKVADSKGATNVQTYNIEVY